MLPGTWEPPWIELDGGDRAAPAAPALERAFPALVPLTLLGRARHTITTRRYEIEVWSGRLESSASQVAETCSAAWGDDEVEEHRFVQRSEIRRLPTSALALKILEVARPQ